MLVRPLLLAAAVALATSACALVPGDLGGGDDTTIERAEEATPVPEALVRMSCSAPQAGAVTVSGVLSNAGTKAARYQVVAYADVPDGQERQARVAVVGPVAGESTAEFSVQGVPTTVAQPQCRAQVLRLPE
jgi:hypothetical protein